MKKKEGRSVQTENNRKMCKHIKDKEKLPFSDHSLCPDSRQEWCHISLCPSQN